jgi:hypothetical protein
VLSDTTNIGSKSAEIDDHLVVYETGHDKLLINKFVTLYLLLAAWEWASRTGFKEA